MPLPSAPVRFALEAMILLAVAFALSIADLGLGPFVLLMALTWLAVAAGERVASGATAKPARTVPTDAESEALPVHADTEEPDSAVAPRRSPFEVLREKEGEEREEEAAPPAPLPAPVPAEPIAAELESEPLLPEEVAPSLPRRPERKPTPEPAPVAAAAARPEARHDAPQGPRPAESREPAPRRVVRGDRKPEPSRQQARIGARGNAQSRWNIWELERLARDLAGQDPWRDEEWTALFVHLREFADTDGMLPPEFDGLVRESFGSLISA